MWAAFTDFSVELLNVGEIEAGLVADDWIVRGTNIGPGGDGSEPTAARFVSGSFHYSD